MPDQMKIPGIGPVDKKYVWAGGALVVGIVGFAWWRAGGGTGGTGDGTTTVENGVDEFAGADPFGLAPPTTGTAVEMPPSTNAEWAVRATERLANLGYEPVAVAAALGKYLTRQMLSVAEADIVRAAIGQIGNPPNGDFPINVKPADSPGGTPIPNPQSETWASWKAREDATGAPAPATQMDWGVIASRTLPANATRLDVYVRSLAMQKKYASIHKQYPMYVPGHIVAGLTYP